MTARSEQRLIWCGTILICGGLLAYGVNLLRPLPDWQPPASWVTTQPTETDTPPRARPLSDYAVIWQRDLRQPMVDSIPEVAKAKPEPPLAIKLLGTAVASNEQMGIFSLANNATVVKRIGEVFDGYELLEVKRGQARLRRGAKEFELKVPWFDRIEAGTD